MRERHVDFGGVAVEGMRVERVVHRPHEDRVYLRGDDDRLWLRFRRQEAPDSLLGATIESIKEVGGAIRIYADGALAARPRPDRWSWHSWPPEELLPFDLPEAARQGVREALGSLEPVPWSLPAERVFVEPPGPFEEWELLAVPVEGGLEVYAQVWEQWKGELRVSPYDAVLRVGADGAVVVLEVDVR